MFYVYILYSASLDVYYKGFTSNVKGRLESHLLGKSEFTSRANDWTLVYINEYETKQLALIEEKRLKKLNRTSIQKLIQG
ncbi:GIY-YIG nuclease family protein [Flavobacterium sp. ARAG 55.4]|uniref:GIY-YIG nuclease family protein n=1 Tax=Flavobacterium plantiphilum TaxID=3163297 RepID=A0ABW8XV18_9FLAO